MVNQFYFSIILNVLRSYHHLYELERLEAIPAIPEDSLLVVGLLIEVFSIEITEIQY